MVYDWKRNLFERAKGVNSFLDIRKLETQIDEAIVEADKSTYFSKKTSFAPSSLGYSGSCSRYQYLAFNGAEFQKGSDALGLFAMKFGTRFGDDVEKLLLAAGVASERQTEVINESPPIKGYTDFLGEIDGETYVADFKTCGDEKYSKILESGVPPKDNLLQILLYMKILKLRTGILIYVNRNTGKMTVVPVTVSERHKEFLEYVFNWMIEVKEWSEGEVIPSRSYPKSNFICKGCAVRATCDSIENVKKIGPGKLIIDIDKFDA